jgi:hypothetical protein
MSNNNTDRLPCTVECEHCGELLCSDPASALCCTRPKAISDGCTIPMWECAGCKADLDAQTEGELASVTHPVVRANILADRVRTTKLPVCSMAELVWPPAPRPRRFQLPTRLIFLAAFVSMMGCATGHRLATPEVETVGQLAAGPSTWTAPVHPTTDLAPAFQAVEGDDSAGEVVTTVSRAADAGGDAVAELPEVAPKSDGIKTGEVR